MKTITVILSLLLLGCATARQKLEWQHAPEKNHDQMYADSQKCLRASKWAGSSLEGEYYFRCMQSEGHELKAVEVK